MLPNNINSLIHENVVIRSIEYLNSKDAALVGTFLKYKDMQIPVVYQHHQPKKQNDDEMTFKIGHATNFRIHGEFMVCDVYLNPLANYASHFQNVIDNYTININHVNNELVFGLTRLIIYDKDFKANRDKEIREYNKSIEEKSE